MADLNLKFNPFEIEFRELKNSILKLEKEKRRLKIKFESLNSINPNELILQIQNFSESEGRTYNKIRNINIEKIKLENKIDNVATKKRRNPFLRFSKSQISVRKEIKNNKKEIIDIENLRLSKITKLDRIKNEKQNLEKNFSDYKSFNFETTTQEITYLEKIISNKKLEFNKIKNFKEEVDKKLIPVIDELEKEIREKLAAKADLVNAEDLQRRLDSTESYQKEARFHIHKESEQLFNNDNPNYIINSKKKFIARSERIIRKLEERAYHIKKKATINIEEIIIDGNNLVWKNEKDAKEFIGLTPLIKLSKALSDNYKITIIFDSDIRGLLKNNDTQIKQRFNNLVNVFIVPSKKKADETILEFASTNNNYYIITNDGYQEFVEFKELINKRIIKHAIIGSQLMIHDLDINISWKN